MSNQKNKLPLGLLLKNADLISNDQLQNALEIQSQYTQMKLGEILVVQEELKTKTIDFFVNKWHKFIAQGQQFPIGYYLKNAALLDEQQIKTILQEQKNNQQKFGVLAAQKGWIKQSTVNFLVDSLSRPPRLMSLTSLEEYNNSILHLEKKYANCSLILSRVLAWTGGNESLTKTICQVFAKSDFNISAGSEIKAVDQFVEESCIRKWQTSKTAEYIRSVKHNFVNSLRLDSYLLLQEYRKILLSDDQEYKNTPEQNELLRLGLIVEQNNHLRVTNIIYQRVFNQDFVSQEISKQKLKENSLTRINVDQKEPEVTLAKYTLDVIPEKVSPNQNKFDEQPELNVTDIVVNDGQREQNSNTPEPLTKMGSLLTLVAIALLIPLFLTINNYYSSLSKPKQETPSSSGKINQLEQFCSELNFSDSSSLLKLISQLEKNKQELAKDYPDDCETTLNHLRVIVAPQLGKENRILEAIRHLCKVPADSKMYVDAEVWLKRWYNSASWGQETKFYLQELNKADDLGCPPASFTKDLS